MTVGSPPAGAPPLHISAVVLPEGEHRELWAVDGVLVDGPVRDALDLTSAFALPGLVDAHCHIGLDPHGPVGPAEAERQAMLDRDAGTLLIRDAGSAADTRWIDDRVDLPRIVRAGRHIATPKRYIRNYAAEIDPVELVAEVRRQARRGDGWVKLVGDWIDRETGDLTPLWPVEVLRPAIAAAHEEGARVTAHTFGEDAVAMLVDAGVDGIEHGTGMSDRVIAAMAERSVALVPTRLQIENFPGFADAGQARYPRYAAHIRDLYARADSTLRKAFDAGVPIYAGTDAGGILGHGLIGAELVAMVERIGLRPEDALAATSWAARSWLGMPDRLVVGAPADLVLYSDDPRIDPHVVGRPARVVLRGRVVR